MKKWFKCRADVGGGHSIVTALNTWSKEVAKGEFMAWITLNYNFNNMDAWTMARGATFTEIEDAEVRKILDQ